MRQGFQLIILPPLAVLAVLVQACSQPPYEHGLRVRWADDAGSVSISPTAVTDWDEVATDLQPNFKMDSATAFANAIPTTQSLDERLASVLSANLQAGLPTTASTRITHEVTDPETGDPVSTIDNTRTRQSGTTPPAAPLAPGTAAALSALSAGTFGDDPMLRYLAATALQQEVALVNRYVRDRVRWPGAQAFVVQLQLTVMPNGRNMPYDVETDITLHANDEQARARLSFPPQVPTTDAVPPPEGRCAADSQDTVQVLPMIVTDNLEGLRAARATDNVRQLALALVGTAGNVGAAGQFANTMEELRRSEGHDTNSLFTIARLSDDTVRIRLGAVQSPRYGHVMIPRNHRISLVVIYKPCLSDGHHTLADDGPRVLTAVTRTAFRDVETGRLLEFENSNARLGQLIAGIQARFVGQFDYLQLARMYQWATRQQADRFFKFVIGQHLQASMCRTDFLNRLTRGRAYRTRPEDYDDLFEPQDYPLPAEAPQTRSPSDPSPSRAEALRSRLVETRDPRCLTLARMRYEMVAAPLWTQLQSIRPTFEFAFTNIPITLRRSTPILPPRQLALLNFSASESNVALSQGQDLSPYQDAQLVLVGAPAGPIPATATTISPNGRGISATFPPLGRFGIHASEPPAAGSAQVAQPPPAHARHAPAAPAAPPAPALPTYTLELRVPHRSKMPWPCDPHAEAGALAASAVNWRAEDVRADAGAGCVLTYPVWLNNSAAAAPGSPFSIDASASGIIANPSTGTGRLIVTVSRARNAAATTPQSLFLSVEGAQLASVQIRGGAAVVREAQGWRVTGPGDLVLELENLIPNTLVKVNLRDGESAAGSVSRSVVAAAARASP
jgi:hypothetical protein